MKSKNLLEEMTRKLVKELEEHDIELNTYKYPDHYQFRESDIPIVNKPILVTEKELEASGRKITKSSPKQNKVTISFKSKIRNLKKR